MRPKPSPVPNAPRMAYLDGLRGWAALVVVLTHLFGSWLVLPAQLRRVGGEWLLDVIHWTPLGIAMDGMQAVYIFFAISGLAISYPILHSSMPGRTLAVMAVYRYPRLTVPILASCLVAYVLLATGAFANIEAARHHADAAWYASLYTFAPDFGVMLKFALWDTYHWMPTPLYWNTVLWTMPVELFGSCLLFAMLAVGRWRWLRLALAIGPGAYWALTTNYGYYFGFFAGYCLAELLVAAERSETVRRRLAAAAPYGWICLVAAFAFSMHLQNVAFAQSREAYGTEMDLIALLTLLGVILWKPARAFLSNSVSQFLGRISFGLYLVHMLVICSFSSALFIATVDRLPYWMVVVVVGGLTVALSIAAGYIFTLVVEERLLRWLKRWIAAIANPAYDAASGNVRGLVARFSGAH